MDDGFGRRRNPIYPPNDQLQLRVDPRGDLDEEIYGLHGKVAQLKQVCSELWPAKASIYSWLSGPSVQAVRDVNFTF